MSEMFKQVNQEHDEVEPNDEIHKRKLKQTSISYSESIKQAMSKKIKAEI